MGRREDLINKVIPLLESGDTLPVVSLEDFFEGNEDRYSIATNLEESKHPGIPAMYTVLRSIRARIDVQDVLIEVQDTPYPDDAEEADDWPISNTLFILTSAPIEVVEEWVRPLRPDLVHEGWNVEDGIKTPSLKEGMRPVRVWWD